MKRKCPKNSFCFKRTHVIMVLTCSIALLSFYFYHNNKKLIALQNNIENNIQNRIEDTVMNHLIIQEPTQNVVMDRISDPLLPPSRDYPINIPTRGEPSPFQQIGVLIENEANNSLKLPLYGSKIYNSKWKYYTSSDNFHNVKLAVVNNNKSCLDNYGCQEINDNDNVSITGYDNKTFKVSLYPVELPRRL